MPSKNINNIGMVTQQNHNSGASRKKERERNEYEK